MGLMDTHDFDNLMRRAATGGPLPERFAVACSGGPDSLALALLAHRWAAGQGTDMVVLTVDHGLRAESASEAQRLVEKLTGLGIEARVLSAPERQFEGGSLQTWARDLRYELLTGWCRRNGIPALLLAHHADDQAETFMLRLARGSGVDGLRSIPSDTVRDGVRLLRPFLSVPKSRLVEIVEGEGLDYVRDPTNEDLRHARSRWRRLMPDLSAEGLGAERIAGTVRRMSRASDALEWMCDRLCADAVRAHEGGFANLDRNALSGIPDEIALRLVLRLIKAVGGEGYPPREEASTRVLDMLRSGAPSAVTLNGVHVSLKADEALFAREANEMQTVAVPVRQGATWDARFIIGIDGGDVDVPDGLMLGPLGREGVRLLRETGNGRPVEALPGIVRPTLPAIRNGERLVAVPSLKWNDEKLTDSTYNLNVVWIGARILGDAPFSSGAQGTM